MLSYFVLLISRLTSGWIISYWLHLAFLLLYSLFSDPLCLICLLKYGIHILFSFVFRSLNFGVDKWLYKQVWQVVLSSVNSFTSLFYPQIVLYFYNLCVYWYSLLSLGLPEVILFYILLVMFFCVTNGLVINNYPPVAHLLHCSAFSASPCFVCPSSAHTWVLFMLLTDKWLYYQSFIWCFLYQFALYFLFSCLPCWPSQVFYICFSFVHIQFSLLQGWHMICYEWTMKQIIYY